MGRLRIDSGIGQLRPDTRPSSIEPAVAKGRPRIVQFSEPLPERVLAATADALRLHPGVTLRAYGWEVDPSLEWLDRFEHIHHLALDLRYAPKVATLEPIARLTALRSLSIGDGRSGRPSLAFLRALPQLEVLLLEGHAKDFDVVADVVTLRRLELRASRLKSLEALCSHPKLEVFGMDFGGLRELAPLAEIPRLRGLALWQVRKLDTDDLEPLGDCPALEAVSLGALRNVASLRALARAPAATMRYLTLERVTGLHTLSDLAACERLEQLGLYDSRPADRRLTSLLECPQLTHLVVGDVYPRDEVEALREGFAGETLGIRGELIRGRMEDVAVRWRAAVHEQLGDVP